MESFGPPVSQSGVACLCSLVSSGSLNTNRYSFSPAPSSALLTLNHAA